MTQLSFRVSPVSIDADITEISACQKMRTDRQTDRQMAFQLYIIDFKKFCVSVSTGTSKVDKLLKCPQIQS